MRTLVIEMAVQQQTSPAEPRPLRRSGGRLLGGGTDGNERLTAATGAVLLVLLAALGITIIRIGQLTWLHLFLGLLLLGPVALKMASTGYRFTRYYTGNAAYRLKGPPLAALRMIAPLVVATTVVVFASGIWLLFAGPGSRSTVMPIHKISFIVWLVFMGVHVLGHLADLPAPLRSELGAGRSPGELTSDVTGRPGRMLALSGALVAGVVLAVVLIPEFASWTHYSAAHAHHHH